MKIKTTNTLKNKMLIFLHIPKCGGATLGSIIGRHFSEAEIFLFVPPYEKCKTSLLGLTEYQRKRIKFLVGHFSYGIHEAVPSPATYITMLRNPVDRIVSHYYFALADKKHPMHQVVVTNKMNLASYASYELRPELINGQTRMLSGRRESDCLLGTEPCSLPDLERAKSHLDTNFSLVGITEKFDESLVALCVLFDWGIEVYKKRNITKKRPSIKDIPKETIRIIEKNNIYDLELYEYACKVFKRQTRELGSVYTRKLRSFKRKKRLYYNIEHLKARTMSFTRRLRIG